MHHQVVNKTCKCCKENLPAAFFYKKEKSPDGLQDWCKYCQNKYNSDRLKRQSKKRHLRNLKRLSTYQLRDGLEYKFVEPKRNGQYRNKIAYKCLNCGKEVISTIETAYQKRFNCDSCNNIENIITPNVDSPTAIPIKEENKIIKESSLAKEIKNLQAKYPNSTITVQINTTTAYKPNENIFKEYFCTNMRAKKKGLFSWIKNLFKKK